MASHSPIGTRQLATASRLYSAGVVTEMAQTGRSKLFARLADQAELSKVCSESDPVSKVFDKTLELLRLHYRDEYVFKNAIARRILLGRHSVNTSVMLTEFRAGPSRADVVILNGTSTAYEIKSDLDNLDKLTRQVDSYLTAFDQVFVVTSDPCVPEVLRRLDARVGILILTDRLSLRTVRCAVGNADHISTTVLLDSLHRHEASKVLAKCGITEPKVPNTKRYIAQRELFLRLPPAQVHRATVQVLKQTRRQDAIAKLLEIVPPSLSAAVIGTPPSTYEYDSLSAALRTTFSDAKSWA